MKTADHQLMSIFSAALDCNSEPERSAFLEQACSRNSDLRARVEALLRAHADAGRFLEPKTVDDSTCTPVEAATVTSTPLPIEAATVVAGRYMLIQVIGEGGMGTVWLAEQTEPLRRKVALKLIKPGMDSREVVGRFEAERQALALMDHPNIAKVHDGGVTDEGRPFFVMELVRGVPITEYSDQARLDLRDRLRLFIQVCQAVQHAHQKGIIHRDLKPSNVLVAEHDAGGPGVVKVIDFGVAKAIGPHLTDDPVHTRMMQMVGTPLYMSPEQAEHRGLDVDTRTDIYSLGVLLYELLTGTTPFDKKRFKAADYDEVRRIIREEEPPKPSARLSESKDTLPSVADRRRMEPANLTRRVRGELDWIVMKALEKDRNRRYETANGFGQDVQRYLADESVLAFPPSVGYRLRKFARRNKVRLAVATIAFLAVTVMAGSIVWTLGDRAARRAEIERAEVARLTKVEGQIRDSLNMARTLIAENKLPAAREELARARARLGSDGSTLVGLAAELQAGEDDLDRFLQFLDLIDRAHQAETSPLSEPTLVADGRSDSGGTLASNWRWERRPAAATPFLLVAFQLYGVLDRDDWNRTFEDGLLGLHQVEQIRRVVYEELLWLAHDVARRKQDHRSQQTLTPEAAARMGLAFLRKAESAHRPTQALFALRAHCRQTLGEAAAARADRRLADEIPTTMAVDHYLVGQTALDARQLVEATRGFEAALRREPTHYWSLMRLGYCLCDLGQGPEDFAAAVWVFSGCVLKRPDHAYAYFCRGNAYNKLGRDAEAAADYAKAIELDPKHPQAWSCQGFAYASLGQADKAVSQFSKSIELDPQNAPSWNYRGFFYANLGQSDKAVADFTMAIELRPTNARFWYNRGAAHNKLGQSDKAVADCSKTIELDSTFAPAWSCRGLAYGDLGQLDKAVADCSKAIELDATLAFAWYNRGIIYDKQVQPDKAVADFSKAIELDPKFALAWYSRGVNYDLKLRRFDNALADYSKAIELDPKFVQAWNNRGWVYHKLGQPGKALPDFDKAIEVDPKHVPAWCGRGLTYRKLDQPEKAVADFDKAIELDSNHPQLVRIYLMRALANCRLGRFEEALADYESAWKRGPDRADTNHDLAWFLANCPDERRRDPHRAIELAKKAVQLAPGLGNYWTTLGISHYRADDWKAAVVALDKAQELHRGAGVVDQLVLAMAHWKLGDQDGARKAYEQAVQWLETNKEALEKDKEFAEVIRRLRPEAEEVLELKKK